MENFKTIIDNWNCNLPIPHSQIVISDLKIKIVSELRNWRKNISPIPTTGKAKLNKICQKLSQVDMVQIANFKSFVYEKLRILPEEISMKRNVQLVEARYLMYYFIKKDYPELTGSEIYYIVTGEYPNRQVHSIVLYGISKVKQWVKYDSHFKAKFETIEKYLSF